MNLLDTIDITKIGNGVHHTCKIDDKLYFNILSEQDGSDSHKIGVLSLNDYKISSFDLPESSSFDIKEDQGKLYVSNFSREKPGKITVYDLETKTSKVYDFDQPINSFYLKNGYVYIMTNTMIYEYKILEDGFQINKQVALKQPKAQYHYYVSGAFFK